MAFDFLKPRSQQGSGALPGIRDSRQNAVDTETELTSSPAVDKTDDSGWWSSAATYFLVIVLSFVITGFLSRYVFRESDSREQGNKPSIYRWF